MTETSSQNNRLRDISLILKDLLKVIKVVSMYPDNNPLPQSMRRSFAEKLVSLVEQYGQIAVSVQKNSLLFENEIVFQDRSKEESLAGIFFETGITDFIFKEGLEIDDVYKLLDAIKDYVNSPYKSRDLAAQIWEAGVNGFTFTTLEDRTVSKYDSDFNLQEHIEAHGSGQTSKGQFAADEELESYRSIFDLGQETNEISLDDSLEIDPENDGLTASGPTERPRFNAMAPGKFPGTVLDGEEIESISLRTAEAAKAMGFDDVPAGGTALPDTTLILNEEFKLSEEEEKAVSKVIRNDAEFDIYESTAEILKEMLFQEVEMNGFYETVTIYEKTMTEFLRAGKLLEASHLLQYLKKLEGEIHGDKPLWAERLKDAYVTAGSRDRLKVLANALNNHPDLGAVELRQYLENFGWEALSGIADLLGEFELRHHREILCDYLASTGRQHPDIVSKGLFDKRWYVVYNSVGILAHIGDDKSLDYLKHTLKHEERRVRLELVTALKNCPNDKALEILREAVMDPDQEIRKEAVNTIIARRGGPAFRTIADIINDESFTSLEHSNQKALLTAFSILGGDAAVAYLSRLILKYNPLRSPILTFYRRAAFEALSHNRSEKGERLLVGLASSWRPDIRRQASATLRRRREIIFGGE